MIIEFHAADRLLALKALGVYRKGIETARGACEKVYCSPAELALADEQADGAGKFVASIDDMEVGEVRDVTVEAPLAFALRVACSCYLAQLSKLAEKEMDLLVPVAETQELQSRLRSLADRLSGQIEMATTIHATEGDPLANATASFNGGPPTTVENAARQMVESLFEKSHAI